MTQAASPSCVHRPNGEGFVEVGPDRRIHYVDLGEGPAVVYFPGNGCCVEDSRPLVDDVTQRFRFVGIDPPGREPTVWPDEPFDFFRDMPVVVDHVLDALKVGEHVALGHSMGGMFGLHHARRHPGTVKGLALFEGFTTLEIHYETCAPDGMRPFRMEPAVEGAWRRNHAANLAWIDAHPAFKASFWPSQQSHDARSWVADLNIPILVFIGENGQSLPEDLDGWRERLGMNGVRDLTVTVIPDAGHWMMLDDPEAVAQSLLPFLERVHGFATKNTPSQADK